ncbi:FtsX-like permease family protein [Nitrococcus mobilis]|uniref:ABC transporter, permease protein n=1 Tax=Nitrococcus mobilis Nb-231 TaxID=314278 RepID=A4BR76_9GAMM|nr:FtsX-like permease family protein [Nitrococcus mobilis]EAR21698.1 ABC transporter, permease protein [Nitrococcus mobilis Nb-231]
MTQSVLRAGRRALWRHPVQLLLAVAGVALGVAVVIGMDLANQSAGTAMRQSMEAVTGRITHQIFGGPEGLPEALYVKLRTRLGVQQAAPVLAGGVTLAAAGNRPLTLLGIDPIVDAPLRGASAVPQQGEGEQGILQDLLLDPGSVVLPAEEAQRLGVVAGGTVTVQVGGQQRRLHVVAVAEDSDHDLSGYAFADIATAQEVLGRIGRLSRIDLILGNADAVNRVRAALPPGIVLVPAAARANAMQQMRAAFQINLTAFSLLALVIGLFLVFNTMSFMVVQRRRMIGILRAVGATRRQILAQVLSDAALIGLLGTAFGVLLGLVLGVGLVDLVGRSSTHSSFHEAIMRFQIEPFSLAKGFLLGIVGSMLAAVPPAFEAATVPPRAAMDRSELERQAHRGARWAAGFGGVALLAGGVILVASSGLIAAFTGLFAVILGASLLAPLASARLTTAMARLVPQRPIARLVLRGVAASLSRTGVAIAALAVAISAVIGVAVMIDSFRGSFIVWLQQSLRADFYIATTQEGGTVDDALAKRIESLPGVAYITRSRHYRLPSADGFTAIWALGLERRGWQSFDIRAGDREAAWLAFRSGRGVLISEPYAYKHGLQVGETLALRTALGERTFRVAGIFRDYGSPYGVVLIYRPAYQRLFADDRLSGLGVYLSAGSERGAVHQRLEAAVAGLAGVRVRDTQSIREHSVAVFDQEFVITSVLRLLAAMVAFVGVVGALMALQLDRSRELAVLRAIGFTRIQLGGLITAQSGVLGLAAGLFSVPMGLLLAWLLVFVINHRAFGWSMEFTISPMPLLEGVGLAIGAALLAALYPAWRAARTLPARGLREE